MTEERSHQFIHAAGLAGRYVAGRMPEPERIAFEDHFVTCAECQGDVRFAGAVRAQLAQTPGGLRAVAPTPAATAVPAGRRRPYWWAGAALAAGVAALMVIRAAPSHALTALGAVADPPGYAGIAVRGSPGRGEAIFASAMQEYAAADYAAATRDLSAALAAGEDSIPTEFFAGASLLFSGDAAAAAPVFGRVAAKGESPYQDEAQWYQAKALLRLGRGSDARAALSAHTPADPAMAARFNALGDSITRALAR